VTLNRQSTIATWRDSKVISAFELLLGAAIVIGHNVFRVVPNEVPILCILGLLSFWLRDGWSATTTGLPRAKSSTDVLRRLWRSFRSGLVALGFKRPSSWKLIIGIALGAAALRILLGDYVIVPFTSQFWPEPAAPEGVEDITGNVEIAALYLGIIWSFAAFGEEIAYRGYLLNRAADVGARSTAAYLVGVVIVAILFGYGHYYKGPAGIVDSGVAGLILGVAWLLAGRNLWACVLGHGFIDTFGVVAAFMGWDS
jgi:membrane protease YdiL (CAAX protease family)